MASQKNSKKGPPEYEVVDPRSNYRGKSYSQWATDWFGFFLSANADKRNSGPVVFLRSHGLPNSFTGSNTSGEPNQVTAIDTSPDGDTTDPDYQTKYVNDPNIRIGSDRLQIFEDQAVFVPILVSYGIASSVRDWGYLQDYTGLLIDNGDNPPELRQLTVNDTNIKLPLEMEQFRITTPIFTTVVPEAPYGTSIKDFLEDGPFTPGICHAMVDGYFVIIKFAKAPNPYKVHAWGSAGRETKGPYFSDLRYEIEVLPKAKRHGMITTRFPARNEGVANFILNKKKQIGEFTDEQANDFKSIWDNTKKNLI